MTSSNITNSGGYEEQAVIEALAVWGCNRQSRAVRNGGGAASWFHECLPSTQESFRDWAKDIVKLIGMIRGLR